MLVRLAPLAAIAFMLAACGGGVSEEEFEAVKRDLEAARSQVQSLEVDKDELQARVTQRALEDIADIVSINELMAFPPTVVDLAPDSASIQMITKLPTTCAVAHGTTARYGRISLDDSMSMGGHTNHYHVLGELQPDTVYHYKWGLLGPDGTLYGSEDLTFKTPPAGAQN